MKQKAVESVLRVPHDCYVILTAQCNLRCLHCYGNYGISVPQHELTAKEWDGVFKNLEKEKVFFVNISGGEPTQHPEFEKILDSLKKHRLYFILTTNGIFGPKILKKLIEVKDYMIGLKISLDGANWKTHCFLRRDIHNKENRNVFDITMKNLNLLKKNNVPFTIATCLHSHNKNQMLEMLQMILTLKPISWFISTISVDGRSTNNLNIFASNNEVPLSVWQKITKECEKNNIFVKYIDMPELTDDSSLSDRPTCYTCPAAKSFCEIYSDGQVSPCPLARVDIPPSVIQFDNLCKKSLKSIWHGKAFQQFRTLSQTGCDGCILKKKCQRCIPQSISWFNDPTKPPPHCIQNGSQLKLDNLCNLKKLLNRRIHELGRETIRKKGD